MGGPRAIRRTRVLFVHTATMPPLGADTWVHIQIMRTLDRDAHEVHVACATGARDAPTPTYAAVESIEDIHIVGVDLGPELEFRDRRGKVEALWQTLPALVSVPRLAWYAWRRRIQIIHTSDRPRDAVLSVYLARLIGAVSIVHMHQAYDPRWVHRMVRHAMRRADVIMVISEFVGRTVVEHGFPSDRVEVVHNAIDLAEWDPSADGAAVRDELAIAAGSPVVVTVCRLFAEKGPAELIRALALVRASHPDAALLVVGTVVGPPEFLDELHELVATLDLGDRVRFLGRRNDVPHVMAAADVYAMPSHHEPFGLVFLEAMAMERPVVAVADGGTVEVVEDGVTGLLSAYGDIEGLADHLRALLSDAGRRAEMGSAGRRRVERQFTTQRMGRRVADVYARVLARRSTRRNRPEDDTPPSPS